MFSNYLDSNIEVPLISREEPLIKKDILLQKQHVA